MEKLEKKRKDDLKSQKNYSIFFDRCLKKAEKAALLEGYHRGMTWDIVTQSYVIGLIHSYHEVFPQLVNTCNITPEFIAKKWEIPLPVVEDILAGKEVYPETEWGFIEVE